MKDIWETVVFILKMSFEWEKYFKNVFKSFEENQTTYPNPII